MSDDSLERRRKEREARRKEREEAMKKEEEEMERQREERKRERERRAEERRLQEEKDAQEEAARHAARTGRTTTTAASDDQAPARLAEEQVAARKKEEEAAEEERRRRRRDEETEEARKEDDRKKRQEEAAEAKKREEEAAEERRQRQRKEKEDEERQQEKASQERAERKRREEESAAAMRREEEADAAAEAERAKERKKREEERARAQEQEEARERKKREDEREERASAARSSSADDSVVSDLRRENATLKTANKRLEDDVKSAQDEADGVRAMLVDAQKENAALKKEIEKLKAAAATAAAAPASATESSEAAAPRLTTATKGRPTKAGRRGAATLRPTATAAEEEDGEESASEPAKPAEKVIARSSGNAAADMLAATMRNASASGGVPSLRKPAGGNVFVSAGTKGGEISRCLFVLKGKTRIRGVRVQDSPNSITQNDVFILETKTHIWTYIGKGANRLKIARAVDVVGKMQRQRGQARAAILETVDCKSDHDDGMDRKRKAFWGEFEAGEPKSIPDGDDDTQWELDFEARTTLSAVEPGFQLIPVGQGKLKQEDLGTDRVYLLDTPNEVFVWCGKGSDMNLRKETVERAQELVARQIADGQKPSWVEVERIAEKGEGALFEDKFFSWSDSMRAVIGKVAHRALSNVAVSDSAKRQELPRILVMHDGELEPPHEHTSDLSGTPEIFLVKDFKRADVPKSEYGTFYSKHCYIMLYRFGDTGVFYYWIGRDAGVTETGTAASLAKEWAGECGLNRPNLVRVDQGKENRHFLRLFKGRMVVFLGERGSESTRAKALFHIRGTDDGDTRAFECPDVNGIYLNSDDAFVLNTKESQYLWLGEFASSHLRAVSDHVCDIVRGTRSGPKKEIEGKESSAFKDAISWSEGYARHETRPNNLPVKYFLCSNSNKQYRADRTADFVQSDLSHSHQAILDRYWEVIVWLGRDTKAEDKKIALEVAVDYVDKANDGRKDCHVWVMEEGDEVVDYSRYFQAWDPYRIKSAKKNVTQRPPLTRRESSLGKARELLLSSDGSAKYPLKTLLDRDYLPAGVDKRTLENYLRDEDFPEAFGMTAKDFFALPAWKRLEKKKTSPLF